VTAALAALLVSASPVPFCSTTALVVSAAALAAGTGLPRSLDVTLPPGNRGAGALVVSVTTDRRTITRSWNPAPAASVPAFAVVQATVIVPPLRMLVPAAAALAAGTGLPRSLDVTLPPGNRGAGALVVSAGAAVARRQGDVEAARQPGPGGERRRGGHERVEQDLVGVGAAHDLEGVPGPDLRVQGLTVTASGGIRSGGTMTVAWTPPARAGPRSAACRCRHRAAPWCRRRCRHQPGRPGCRRDLAAATPITPGTPVTATLAPGSATAIYSFTAGAETYPSA
jgi:hypothetical protein